jgi:hypothetical protein
MALLIGHGLWGAEMNNHHSWGPAGFTLERQCPSRVKINYSLAEYDLSQIMINGEHLHVIRMPGLFLPNDAGAPGVPGSGRYVAVPEGASVDLRILAMRTETYTNIDLAPAFGIPLSSGEGLPDFERNMEIYAKDAFYPGQPVVLSKPESIRGVDAVMIGITPFQYNPVTRELRVYKDIQIELSFTGGNGHFGDDRLRSRWWDPLLSDVLLNFGSLPLIDYDKKVSEPETTGYEYLIICPDEASFVAQANIIRDWRLEQGISTGVVTTIELGGNTAPAIENYINTAYYTWTIPPAACLLLGDYGTSGPTVASPIYNSYCVSDNIYADVDGNHLPDIILARITAQNSTQLQHMVSKFIDYETSPPTDPDFYGHPITSCGWSTGSWCQLCAEVIGGFWKHALGKTPVRINEITSGVPDTLWSTAPGTEQLVNYFGPNGLGYIPLWPSTLGGWTGGNATQINDAINAGAFMVLHRGQGSETGWYAPAYHNSDIDGCMNINNRLPWVFSLDCLTGKFNYGSEVFAEKFHRQAWNGENAGALGVTAASEVTYSFVTDIYAFGMIDYLWPDFMPDYTSTPASQGILPAFGNAAGKYFLQQYSFPFNPTIKQITYHLFHHHGDAFGVVYSEVPQTLTVLHTSTMPAGATAFEVTADEGSFIALTANGEIIGTGEGSGFPESINIAPQPAGITVKVVVTKQNHFRYSALVNVLASGYPVQLTVMLEGPYESGQMSTGLCSSGYLPLAQPYSTSPWLYMGTEAVAAIPSAEVVDWILVEFRQTAGGASTANSSTMIEREAAFLMKDGGIVGTDGSSVILLDYPVTQNLFVVLWHRNHLAVMSAVPLVLSGGGYSYDFTLSASQAYGGANALKDLGDGKWGMVSGDGDANGQVSNSDKNEVWRPQSGNSGYLSADFSLDGQVDNNDKNDCWMANSGRSAQLPLP